MKTSPEALRGILERRLPGVCLVTGTEPQLIAESCDAIRARARDAGYAEREVHFLERGFDWDGLLSGAASLSLFASLRIMELKFSSAPDAASGKALAGLAGQPPPDTLLLVSGVLDWKGQKAGWLKAFEKAGLLVMTSEVGRAELPRWIAGRLSERGVKLERDAAELLADRVEGNLLAAQQEVERIALLMPDATLDAAAVEQLVADSARYDIFELAATTFAGKPGKALRILAGLKAEGHEPTLVLWALASGLRSLSRAEQWSGQEGRPLNAFYSSDKTWWSLRKPIESALRRLPRARIDMLLRDAARVDRIVKGGLRGDPWVALEGLVARIGGIRLVSMRPLGIFGGTFDPIHYGHLRSAFELQNALGLAELRFIPAGDPPHRSSPLADAGVRLKMIQAAIDDQPGFVADDRELRRDGPSYTVTTLLELRQEFPGVPICLLVGMDAFLGLPEWHRWREILPLAHLVVAHRPGWSAPVEGVLARVLADHQAGDVAELTRSMAGRIYIHPVTQLEISSTELREIVAAGRDPRYLVPDSVRELIRTSDCYTGLHTR